MIPSVVRIGPKLAKEINIIPMGSINRNKLAMNLSTKPIYFNSYKKNTWLGSCISKKYASVPLVPVMVG